jgi:hypothetical protein
MIEKGQTYTDKGANLLYEVLFVGEKSLVVNELYVNGGSEMRTLPLIQWEIDVRDGELIPVEGGFDGK